MDAKSFFKGKLLYVTIGAVVLVAFLALRARSSSSAETTTIGTAPTVTSTSNPNAATRDDITQALASYGKQDSENLAKSIADLTATTINRENAAYTQLTTGFNQAIEQTAQQSQKGLDSVSTSLQKQADQTAMQFEKSANVQQMAYDKLATGQAALASSVTSSLSQLHGEIQQTYGGIQAQIDSSKQSYATQLQNGLAAAAAQYDSKYQSWQASTHRVDEPVYNQYAPAPAVAAAVAPAEPTQFWVDGVAYASAASAQRAADTIKNRNTGTAVGSGPYSETVSGVTYRSENPTIYNGGAAGSPSYYNNGVPVYI